MYSKSAVAPDRTFGRPIHRLPNTSDLAAAARSFEPLVCCGISGPAFFIDAAAGRNEIRGRKDPAGHEIMHEKNTACMSHAQECSVLIQYNR